MRTLFNKSLFISACILLPVIASAQNVITVSTVVMPPFGNKLEALANNTKVIIQSNNIIYSATLKISIKGDNGIKISTPKTIYNLTGFDIEPNVPAMLTASQLSEYFDLRNLVVEHITPAELRQNGLPPGQYKICVRVVDSDYFIITGDDPTGCSATFEIKNAEPPQLLTPQCNTAVPFNIVPNILFSWTPAIGAPSFTQYTLRIVEMQDTTVSPANAMQSATTPPFFEQTVTGAYSFLYGAGQPMMDAGKKYAWQVTASDGETNTPFQNEGKSEVCSFTLQTLYGIAVPPEKDNKKSPSALPAAQIPPVLNIPYAALIGKLEWAFPKTEEGAGVTEAVTRVTSVQFNQPEANLTFDPNAVSSPGANLNGYFTTGGNSGSISVSGVSPTVTDIFKQQQLSVFQKQQDAINKLAGMEKHPLANVKIDFTLWIKDEVIQQIKKLNVFPGALTGPMAELENEIYIGSATTKADGTFQLTFLKPIPQDLEQFYNLDIDIKEEHFDFPTISVPIVKDAAGIYSIGTLTGLAKVYRFRPIVRDQDGNAIETVKLTIQRDMWFNSFYSNYPNLKWEGSRSPDSLLNLTYVADGKNTNIFKRMFMSPNIFDYYLLKATAEGYTTTNFYFSAGSGKISTLKSGVTLVEKIFVMQANDPMVKGRVVSKETEIPLSNVTVTVKSESGKSFSIQTGPDGKFTIADIPVSEKPYSLLVNTGMGDLWKDPNPLYLNKKGIIEVRDPLLVEAQLFTVKGVVANINSQVLNSATVAWASGGKPVFTNSEGWFVTAHPLGKDTLIVSKDGYRDARVPVDLKKSAPNYQIISEIQGAIYNPGGNTNNWQLILSAIGGGNKEKQVSGNYAAQSFGYTDYNAGGKTIKADESMLVDLFGGGAVQEPALVLINLDTIKLKKFYVQVTVKDAANNTAIANAKVKAGTDKPDVLTNSKGIAILEDVSYGTPTFYVYGPAGSAYIPIQQQTQITAAEDTAKIIVKLEKGALISGKVTATGTPVEGAKVYVVGMDFIFSVSDSAGNYQMPGIPVGTHTLRAVKSGYIGDEKAQSFIAKNYTINFNITKPDFDASKLLGFDVQLYHVTPGSIPNEYVIDGELVNLPSNNIFSFSKSVTLEFPPTTVIKNSDGTIQPKAGKVATLTSNLPLKVLGFLNVVAYNSSGLQVVPQGNDMKKGGITANIKMDMSSAFFSKTSFLKYPSTVLQLVNGAKDEIVFISSEGNIPNQPDEFQLKSQSATWTIYNTVFTADLPNCKVSSGGINLKGTFSVNNIPGLGNISLQVENCNINTSGELQEVKIKVNPNPVLNLYSWALTIKSATLNQFGFKFGGDMMVKIPSTSDMKINFSNLSVNSSGITGGAFNIWGSVSVLGIVNYSSSMGKVFQLGKVPGKNAYRLTGTGSINFAKYLTDNISLESFSIATDGNLEMKANTGFSYNIVNVADFNISKIEFNTAIPEVAVTGNIALYLPGFNTGAGGRLHFKKSNFASIDDVSFKLSLNAIGSIGATASFTGNGFKGACALKIANSSIGEISSSFSYEKLSSGIKLAIGVVPGLPPIPLVGTVSLENIGGKVMLNTSNNIYAVTLSGRIVVAPGTSALVSLDPIAVTVSASAAGPVLQGDAYVKIISWNIGKAEFRIDYPNKLLFVKESIEGGFNLLPGVSLSGKQELVFTASAKSGDMYWFAGMYADVNMIGDLVKGNGSVVLAWGLSKYGHPEFSEYTNFIPDESLDNGRINGVNVYADVSIGVKKEDADCANFAVGKICGYAYSNTKGLFYSNFLNGTIGVSISSVWAAEAWAELFGFSIGGLAASASGELGGGHDNARGWWFSGKASGNARAWAGCCGSDCGNKICWGCCVDTYLAGEVCPCPCGAKVCASVSVNVSISEKQGSSVGIDLF